MSKLESTDLETIQRLSDAKTIAEHVYQMLTSKMQYPTFGQGGVPVSVAASVFGKSAAWVQIGIISGWLPIGNATKEGELLKDITEIKSSGRTNYYISPKLLWEITGYVWKGK